MSEGWKREGADCGSGGERRRLSASVDAERIGDVTRRVVGGISQFVDDGNGSTETAQIGWWAHAAARLALSK